VTPDLTAWAAFSAGLLSFLSPCVLPLVPGYISFMSGLSLEELSQGGREARSAAARKAGLGSILFVLGFSAVFIALGASASAAGRLLEAHLPVLSRVAGALIVLFGLHTMGVLPIRALYLERRFSMAGFSPGLVGSFLMGFAFAFGWTPCIGPILAGILALAATQETVWRGVVLLSTYSAGLGLPFILTGFGVNAFMAFFRRYRPFIRWGEVGAGALLVAVGILVFSNRLTYLIRFIPGYFYGFVR